MQLEQELSSTAFATTLERETVVCRLANQEMRLSPRNTALPDVDLRVPGQPAQSALKTERSMSPSQNESKVITASPKSVAVMKFVLQSCKVWLPWIMPGWSLVQTKVGHGPPVKNDLH